MATYKFDKRLLTVTDLQNILIALAKLNEWTLDDQTRMTLDKIRALLPQAHGPANFSVSNAPTTGRQQLAVLRKKLLAAIQQSTLVRITYVDRLRHQTVRRIEPYQLVYRNASWYLLAYSLERNAFRTFKLARIVTLTILESTLVKRELPPTSTDQPVPTDFKLVKLTVLVKKDVRDKLIEGIDTEPLVEVNQTHYQTTFVIPDNEYGYRYIAEFGTSLQVFSPALFKAHYKTWLLQIIQHDQTL
ncbi:helix-turn-helix transcriptional regulator [Lactiplantibacillus plantarum]|uniref:helix-turn-helix transcriptional regulator n=1 Tax=Lactiplantibacillus plantarum TaxID=1590 RepID=UPI0021CB07EA|nr:WYL domain-containing protein [Lactiplantibacillus plantarum]